MELSPPLASVALPIVSVGIVPEQIVSPVFAIAPAVNAGRKIIFIVFEVAVVAVKQAPPLTVMSQVTTLPSANVVLA